jgi:hypothetical protein
MKSSNFSPFSVRELVTHRQLHPQFKNHVCLKCREDFETVVELRRHRSEDCVKNKSRIRKAKAKAEAVASASAAAVVTSAAAASASELQQQERGIAGGGGAAAGAEMAAEAADIPSGLRMLMQVRNLPNIGSINLL